MPRHDTCHNISRLNAKTIFGTKKKSVLGIHVSPAFSLLGIPSRLAFGLTWRSVARRSVARRTVAPAFGLPGVRSPRRSVAWRSVAVPMFTLCLDYVYTMFRLCLDYV